MPSGLTAISASVVCCTPLGRRRTTVRRGRPALLVGVPLLFVALAAAACTYGIDIYSISGSARSPPWGTPSVARTSR